MGNIKKASKIDLSNKGLTEIPVFIFSCKNLRSLNLSNNRISSLPVELSYLKNLRNLDLSNNRITQLQAKIFDLKKLELLNLNQNLIKRIPRQIGQLAVLKKLLLNRNQLTDLPTELGRLKQLTHLGIANNKITFLPEAVFQLEQLTHLWIAKNPFRNFAAEKLVGILKNLRAVYSFDPEQQGMGMNTSIFQTRGNSLKEIKLSIFTDSTSKFMNAKSKQKSIFISYSHKDVAFKNDVEDTLRGVQNVITDLEFEYWADDQIDPGDFWEKEIETALDKAGIAILLASRHFIASKFIMKKEVPPLLQRAQERGVRMLVLIVGDSLFDQSPLIKFQFINTPETALKSLTEHERDIVYKRLGKAVISHFES